jgi:hypothetical protein
MVGITGYRGDLRLSGRRLPAILTTGYLIDEQVIQQSTAYIRRPYTLDQLEQTIAMVLLQQRSSLQT